MVQCVELIIEAGESLFRGISLKFVKVGDSSGGRGLVGLEFWIASINKAKDSGAGGSFAIDAHGAEGSSKLAHQDWE